MTDAHWIVWGLFVGVPVGLVLMGFMELFETGSKPGEFWQAFKDEARK